jgi:hypothetical protein
MNLLWVMVSMAVFCWTNGASLLSSCAAEHSIDSLLALYEKAGNEIYNIGESITQIQHAEQAARLAREAGFEDQVILAALFHDVGHILGLDPSHPLHSKLQLKPMPGGLGTEDHENIGAGKFVVCFTRVRIK